MLYVNFLIKMKLKVLSVFDVLTLLRNGHLAAHAKMIQLQQPDKLTTKRILQSLSNAGTPLSRIILREVQTPFGVLESQPSFEVLEGIELIIVLRRFLEGDNVYYDGDFVDSKGVDYSRVHKSFAALNDLPFHDPNEKTVFFRKYKRVLDTPLACYIYGKSFDNKQMSVVLGLSKASENFKTDVPYLDITERDNFDYLAPII